MSNVVSPSYTYAVKPVFIKNEDVKVLQQLKSKLQEIDKKCFMVDSEVFRIRAIFSGKSEALDNSIAKFKKNSSEAIRQCKRIFPGQPESDNEERFIHVANGLLDRTKVSGHIFSLRIVMDSYSRSVDQSLEELKQINPKTSSSSRLPAIEETCTIQ